MSNGSGGTTLGVIGGSTAFKQRDPLRHRHQHPKRQHHHDRRYRSQRHSRATTLAAESTLTTTNSNVTLAQSSERKLCGSNGSGGTTLGNRRQHGLSSVTLSGTGTNTQTATSPRPALSISKGTPRATTLAAESTLTTTNSNVTLGAPMAFMPSP